MKFFAPDTRRMSQHHQKLYAAYELAFTVVEFAAGTLFLVGSWLFFYRQWENEAIWCFLIGSACFMVGPTLKLVREVHFAAVGDFADLAERARH